MKTPFLLGAFALASFAQQPSAPPNPDAFNQAVQILNGNPPVAPAKTQSQAKPNKKGKAAPTVTGTIDAAPIAVQRQAPLPANARLALELSEGWLSSGMPPSLDAAGRVLYTYGQGVPTTVCAVLQVCELDLEPGEAVAKDALDWGDHRFEVATRTAGSGSQQFTYLVLKPTEPGLDTTMTVGTTRRLYYVRLVSTSREHMARVAFSYPEEEARKRKAETDAKKAEEDRQKAEAERLAKLNTQRPFRNWDYHVQLHGKDAKFLMPQRIGDDGVHTHISLSEEARRRGLPVMEISDARGPIPANSHWDGNELIIDAVFEHGCLVESVGRKQQRACIFNDGLKKGGQAGGGN